MVDAKQMHKANRLTLLKNVYESWQKKQEETIVTKEAEKCERCGKTGVKLTGSHGKIACSMCQNMAANVKNRPDVVIDMLREIHGDKYLQQDNTMAKIMDEIVWTLDCPDYHSAPEKIRQLLENSKNLSEKMDDIAGFREDSAQLANILDILGDHFGPDISPLEAVRRLMLSKISTITATDEEVVDLGHKFFLPPTSQNPDTPTSGATGIQIGGNHYIGLPIGPTEYSQKNGLGCCESAVIKYVTRHKQKGGRQDIMKAIHFLQLLEEIEYKAED